MDLLLKGSRELGLTLSPDQVAQFRRYQRELLEWNRRVRLTALVRDEDIQVKHFLDSLTVAPALPPEVRRGGWVMDVGSGGGFPGVPLKILYPAIHLTLLDATAKKTAFLEHLVSVLGLESVQVLTGRAEELAHQPGLREAFDVVLARALAPLRVLAEVTIPFCRPGGIVVAQKKSAVQREVAKASKALGVLGARLRETVPVEVASLRDGRVLVLLEKVQPTPPSYPRRPGIPRKRPL
ncbi:MAG: 16S rRNA (guanine(527)-N(7))-methyltransferase RsmG [Dehalococcoidia bacterium]